MNKSWKLLGNLIGSNKPRNDIVSILDGSTELTETKDIVEKFAEHFSGVGQNLDSLLPMNNSSPYSYISRNLRSFCLFPVTATECFNIISKLKITYTDINQVPVKIFKCLKQYISQPLTEIMNASFTQGVFPKAFKLAKITPVYKKGSKTSCSNHRPISSLPFLSKIFERGMTNRVVSFFMKFSLFSHKQFGFLKNRSTQDALLDFTENIYDALNISNHNISILVDLKSAFDTVNHNILLNKLELYGIRGNALNWFRSYLADREFYVALDNIHSTHKIVNIGIPQGSIIGPVLFIIYNNDLPLVSNELNTTLFADDTNFSLSHKSIEDMIPILNTELQKVMDWTTSNRLTVNSSKTELLLFTNRRPEVIQQQVLLNGSCVDFVDHARFLGVMVDNKINFKGQINQVVNKVAKHAGILYKVRDNLPLSARITYYNSFVLPYLNFNLIHWGNTNDVHLDPLVKIQKRILRTICNADYLAHTTPLFFKLKLLKLKDLYKYQAVLDTHIKMKNGSYRIAHGRNTRNCNLALPKFHSLTRTQQSITFQGPTLWNDIPESIRSLPQISSFKKALKNYYLEQYGSNDG